MRSLPTWGLMLLAGCGPPTVSPVAPDQLRGEWQDDYGIRYLISDTLWLQRPGTRYQVVRWDDSASYLVARNGPGDVPDAGLFTRIDWVRIGGMPPWEWAFCLATWDAPSAEGAALAPATDGAHPRTGCGGHPFSRMRRVPAESVAVGGGGDP